ncbi:hypothetical protein CHL76_13170 [Marinococcus halophilus]|uniref:hypothetical protein n=1 Tax=Marinococcus halophilus TaxID=1371 RepID=UPI000B9FF9C0|nr:hypothetical protein [Marinococcus halophilus]OZT79360.1 hypothetical protein CHL76_13170 [Marinococcus halophilus]
MNIGVLCLSLCTQQTLDETGERSVRVGNALEWRVRIPPFVSWNLSLSSLLSSWERGFFTDKIITDAPTI